MDTAFETCAFNDPIERYGPKRVPGSPHLKYWYENEYAELPVMQRLEYGPLIENYLNTAWETMVEALKAHARVFALRFDLRYPSGYFDHSLNFENPHMSEFFDRLQRLMPPQKSGRSPTLRYLWARERRTAENPHYHLVLLVDRDCCYTLGNPGPGPNGGYNQNCLGHRIVQAWGDTLSVENLGAVGPLIHYSRFPGYPHLAEFHLCNDKKYTEMTHLFYATSYLCKAYTKEFGRGFHCFGSSRGGRPSR